MLQLYIMQEALVNEVTSTIVALPYILSWSKNTLMTANHI